MKRKVLEAMVASALLQGCAYGSIDDVEEELNRQTETKQNCQPPSMEKCEYRARANMVMDLEVTPFEMGDYRAEFTAFNFSPNETFMLSYATTRKENESGVAEAAPGSVISLPDGSTIYVGKVYVGSDFKTSWAFLYYVDKGVATQEINQLATHEHKTVLEEAVFRSNCITRKYQVEVFQEDVLMPNAHLGPGAVITAGLKAEEMEPEREFFKAVLPSPSRHADGLGFVSYGYGMDAFQVHSFNAGKDFVHSNIYLIEDVYKCK